MVHYNRVLIVKLKRIILFSFLLCFVSSCSSQKTTVNTTDKSLYDLKVMTFNIRYGTANDGDNSWSNRRQILFNVIRDFNPDILGMQEVLKFQLDELLEEMPYYSYCGVGRDDGRTEGEYSPILFSKDRYILDSTETFWFSDTPDIPGSKNWGNNITRICTWAKLFDKFAGKTFYFMNVHLDHQVPESRIKSAKALVDKIKSFNDNLPVVLTGDFNTGEDEQTIKIIKEYGLIDSYRILNKRSNAEGTFNSFIGEDNKDKIDFIFVSEHFSVKNSTIIKTNKNGRYPSDHFPVTAVVEFVK